MQGAQLTAILTTLVTLVLAASLAAALSARYAKKRERTMLFWALGLWAFSLSVLLEFAFAMGAYSGPAIDAYLFIVAILVELLALGSIQLVKSEWIRKGYYVLAAIGAIAVAYSLFIANIGNLLVGYVVAGQPPLPVIIASALATFPASAVIAIVAALGYRRSGNPKLLSIVAGIVVVGVAGTLYIASFPTFLYIAEFFGVLLLWVGFAGAKRR
ncbi:MAG: hypothetical protein KGH78_03925 [Candidatus Micrarchaeota archaeon]|nr:hypothetical protein [Candidatus Micrarchaeota archaeon]